MAVKDGLPATDFSRQNREWVKAVAGGGSGGGGGLPEITPADEGKVLTVESGAAAWATAGGGCGGSILFVNTVTENSVMHLDKTYNEIKSAMAAGTLVIVSAIFAEEGYYNVVNSLITILEQATPGVGTQYSVSILSDGQVVSFFTYNADGYPELAL